MWALDLDNLKSFIKKCYTYGLPLPNIESGYLLLSSDSNLLTKDFDNTFSDTTLSSGDYYLTLSIDESSNATIGLKT